MSVPQYTVVKPVTIPFHLIQAGETFFCQFVDSMKETEVEFGAGTRKAKNATGKKEDDTKAFVADVINLENGELVRLICHAVVKANLNTQYQNHTYVDKQFLLKAYRPDDRKAYLSYIIKEIADFSLDDEAEEAE